MFLPFITPFVATVEARTYHVTSSSQHFPTGQGYINFHNSILPLTFTTFYKDSSMRFHLNDTWISTTVNLTFTAWFSGDWLNYTVNQYGTQKVYNGSKPTSVYLDETQKSEGDGWSYSGGIITVTGATTSGALYWGGTDTTSPTYSSVAHNTTMESDPCGFSCLWEDETALSGFIFSWNGTVSWTNETWTSLSGNPAWANKTKTLPTSGTEVGYRWYCNDTSNNWASAPIYTLTTTSTGENIVVLLNTPSDGATSKTKAVSFTFIPIFFETIVNASAWLNLTGTWQYVALNSSTVQNNTVNTISYNFTDSGTYLWNVAVCNSSHRIFAQQNRTITMMLEPEYGTMGHSTSKVGQSCKFYVYLTDGDGLSGFIFSWNVTKSWQNGTWSTLSGNSTEAWAETAKTLPNKEDVVIGFRFYANDTDNKWVATSLQTFTTEGSDNLFSTVFSSIYFSVTLMGVIPLIVVGGFLLLAIKKELSLDVILFLALALIVVMVSVIVVVMIIPRLTGVF